MMSYLGRGQGPLPPYVSMMPIVDKDPAPRFVESSHGQDAGWLGPLHHPMRIDADPSKPGYKVGAFEPLPELSLSRHLERRELRRELDGQLRRLEGSGELQAADAHYRRAFDLLASREVTKAFDLSLEPAAVRERYGMTIHGQSVLQARRLVEAGVPLVTVFWPNDGITNVSVYWDTHNRNFIDLKTRLCPVTDRAFSALLDDLSGRGLLDETLIVWAGEMGARREWGNRSSVEQGRAAMVAITGRIASVGVLAGGGIKGGVVHGASDRYAAYPAASPTRPADLAATIYSLLGVDPHTTIYDRLKRPLTLCEGQPIRAIMS